MLNDDAGGSLTFLAEYDPRLKLVSLVLFSVLVAVLQRWPSLMLSAVFALVTVMFSGLSALKVLKRLMPVNMMVLFLFIFLPFSMEGQGIFQLGPFTAVKEGLDLSFIIAAKTNIMMLVFISFVATTPVMTVGRALECVGLPYKLVHLFFFTYRYIHVIYNEYITLRTAMTVRGFVPTTSVHTYRSYAYLVGMLLVRSSDRAERVYRAMICRGFNGKFYSLKEFTMNRRDIVVFISICAWILITGWVEWWKTVIF